MRSSERKTVELCIALGDRSWSWPDTRCWCCLNLPWSDMRPDLHWGVSFRFRRAFQDFYQLLFIICGLVLLKYWSWMPSRYSEMMSNKQIDPGGRRRYKMNLNHMFLVLVLSTLLPCVIGQTREKVELRVAGQWVVSIWHKQVNSLSLKTIFCSIL